MNDSKTRANLQDLPGTTPPDRPTVAPAFGGPEGGGRSPALPCLYSNNSIGDTADDHRKDQILALCGLLSPYQKRQAHTLFLNV